MKANLLFAALVLTTVTATAQTSTTQMPSALPKKKFAVMLDGASVAMRGVGVKATMALSEKLSVGLLAQKMKIKSSSSSAPYPDYSYNHNITNIGVIADYYLTNTNSESGLYGSAALIMSNLKTEVQDVDFGPSTSEDSGVGLQIKMGYQIVSKTVIFPSDIILQLGLGYGSAGSVAWQYSGSSLGSESETKLQSGLLLDLSAGVTF